MRVIGLIGRSYCGSTLASILLGSIDGVESVGEPHWLIDDPDGRGLCTAHDGNACPTADAAFLASLSDDNLYGRLGELFGCEVLVSSDKYEGYFERFVEPNTMDGIICFRSPHATVWSDRKRGDAGLIKSVNTWRTWYIRVLRWAPQFCRRYHVLNFDLLTLDPTETMRQLCRKLHLPSHFKVPPNLSRIGVHRIGGNDQAYIRTWIERDDAWRKHLTTREIAIIDEDKETMDVFRRLQKLAIRGQSCES